MLEEATGFLDGLPVRPVAARTDVEGVAAALRRPLPEEGAEPLEVIEELIAGAEPGVVAMPSGRFFGWVIGGVLPATLAADWLTSTWDQNAGLLASSPAAAGAEWVASEWLRRLLKDGTAWMTPSTWHGQAVLRISVSNWRTTEEDVDRTLAAVRRVLAEVRAG